MLKYLRVKNFVLIKEAELNFAPGLNLFTGETGAGKSLLISAIEVLLGGKTKSELVRRDTDKAVVEGEFRIDDKEVSDYLRGLDLECVSDELIMRREISENGRTRNFINDSPVTIKQLSDLTDWLIDLCGQHEHQTLLRKEFHLDYVDRYAGLMEKREELASLYQTFRKLNSEFAELKAEKKKSESWKELKEFEIAEIEKVKPESEEEDRLLIEEKTLRHGEQIIEFCASAEEKLNDMPGSAIDIIGGVSNEIQHLAEYSAELQKASEDIESANALLNEAFRSILNLRVNFDFSQERLEEIRIRLGQLSQLKRKYGGTVEAVLENLIKLKEETQKFSNLDDEINRLSKKIANLHKILEEKAGFLSKVREACIPELIKSMETEMRELGFESTAFDVRIERLSGEDIEYCGEKYGLSANGIDKCEIYISTNSGEPLLPMKDIASGGEISRILLALKSVIAGKDKSGTLVFDEIDKGISGRIARKVGFKLLEASKDQQVFVITHLPQIASVPGRHFSVVKSSDNDRAVTSIVQLTEGDRIQEIGKLLSTGGGAKRGEEYAKELLTTGSDNILFDE